MINFKDYLTEGRDAPLFHGTDIDGLIGILESNSIVTTGFHEIDGKQVKGISLTRNIEFAKEWSASGTASIYYVLELDQAKLAQNYKIKPFNYFRYNDVARNIVSSALAMTYRDKHKATHFPHGFDNQMEEHVIGTIKNLDKYLISIITNNLNLFSGNEYDKLTTKPRYARIIDKFKNKVKYIGKWADD